MGILADNGAAGRPTTLRPMGGQPYPVSNAHQPIGQQWATVVAVARKQDSKESSEEKTLSYEAVIRTYDSTTFQWGY